MPRDARMRKGEKMKDEYIEVDKIIDFIDEHIKGLDDGEAYRIIEYYLEFADRLEIIRCKDCKQFMKYSKEYKQKVESADGDCYLKVVYGNDEQFAACRLNDFCSKAKRREDEEDS